MKEYATLKWIKSLKINKNIIEGIHCIKKNIKHGAPRIRPRLFICWCKFFLWNELFVVVKNMYVCLFACVRDLVLQDLLCFFYNLNQSLSNAKRMTTHAFILLHFHSSRSSTWFYDWLTLKLLKSSKCRDLRYFLLE